MSFFSENSSEPVFASFFLEYNSESVSASLFSEYDLEPVSASLFFLLPSSTLPLIILAFLLSCNAGSG